MRHLHELILESIPDAEVTIRDYAGKLIGYGTYAYRTAKGPAGDWFAVGLANRSRYISLYSMGLRDGGYLVEAMHDRFPGTKAGRSCLNISKPDDVDDDAVRELVRATWAQFRDRSSPPERSAEPAD
ncbi:MAG: DUF1801 domain-containing protein [Chloroflexi bacterium]|nr:DUF1801 domain-containing protein [Chloroflexota bacterium]